MTSFPYCCAMPTGAGPTQRPELQPYDVDERPVILVGIALWALALLVLFVFFRDDLRRHDTDWWLWSCVVGIGLGLYGLRFVSRRRRAIERDRASRQE